MKPLDGGDLFVRRGAFRERRAAVVLRSGATKNPKPLREYYVFILTNETHRLYMESESPG